MRLTEPVSFTVIFPFINKMIEDLNIAPDRTQVGTYAGLIESLFALAQLCTVLFWGRLSDRIGRKPVLLSGLLGLSIGIIAFGLQKTLIGLVIARSFAGAMNGNIAVVKSALAEITDETNKAKAFPLLPLCYALGLTIGPAIGGYTADPAKQYPNSVFADWPLFSTYPYFLPCLLSGLLNLLAFVLGTFGLDETLPSKAPATRKAYTLVSSTEDNEQQQTISLIEVAPPLRALLTKYVTMLLISFGFMAFENSAWLSIVPLFSYTRVEDGGLGLNLDQIGMTLSANGVVALVVQGLLFPHLHRRMGVVRLYRLVRLSYPIAFMSLPLVRAISQLCPTQSSSTSVSIFAMVLVMMGRSVGNMSIVCMTLLINDSAPNHASLGSVNGLGQSVASFSRAISPFLAGKLFSISISGGQHGSILQKNLVWLFFIPFSIVGYSTTWMIEENLKKPTQPYESIDRRENPDTILGGPSLSNQQGERQTLIPKVDTRRP